MKTLKDLRAALVVGSRWHLQQSGGWSPGIRTLGHVQGNAFAFKSNDPAKLGALSWCDFPKASEVKLGDREFTITHCGMNNDLHYTREDKWLEEHSQEVAA